jgi:hypothetical protein
MTEGLDYAKFASLVEQISMMRLPYSQKPGVFLLLTHDVYLISPTLPAMLDNLCGL